MPRTTIKDIAKALNISPSTVSRALKDHPDISIKLKEKIKHTVDMLGYMPNQFASNLRIGKSFTIGLIVPEISIFFFPSVTKAVEELTHKNGYRLIILHSNNTVEGEKDCANICAKCSVDGVLLSLSKNTQNLDHLSILTDNGIPIVFYDKIANQPKTHNVNFNNGEAVKLAVNHLFNSKNKPKQILGIFDDKNMTLSNTKERIQAFKIAMQKHGVNKNNFEIIFADSVNETYEKCKEKLLANKNVNAILAMGDDRLMGVSKVVTELKLKVPNEVIVTGLSDGFFPTSFPFHFSYSLTSGYEMGLVAATLLFDLIAHKDIDAATHFVDTPFVA